MLIIAGYFDWFSGYQETALATAFAKIADTEVVASNRVSPAFNDTHLSKLGMDRDYQIGSREEHGVTVTRFAAREKRSMVWSTEAARYLSDRPYDLVVQVMPGQIFSVAPSLTRNPARRVVLYGDNRAMWGHLSRLQRMLKGTAFAMSKGVVYAFVNARADKTYGYTPNTLNRLRAFRAGSPMEVMPLAYSPERFFFSDDLRQATRARLGFTEDERVILAAGKFEQRKRLDWLISAFEHLAVQNQNLRLILVGADSSTHSKQLEEQIAGSPHSHRVTVMGFVDSQELNAIFNAADLAVWPRNPAITIQQAMGTGLPVVLPENDLVGHLIRPGTGLYYPLTMGHEVRALQRALQEVLMTFDYSGEGRLSRLEVNSWLSADSIAASLVKETPDS
ncbi:glycosyltransferase involved in cell wall biosynthesis [Microlunatus panaciterrae]|uniref:Glycosyltransferase involved in cell wall biosynthesis n=1 Tax=Microlunatus panaciterrae TaxID=400768 RepID=A0ABS2RKS6_9ACTN|nr:glycosyltransferase involved in cell wall biosynthesis [Microlunatus panaciterrae]